MNTALAFLKKSLQSQAMQRAAATNALIALPCLCAAAGAAGAAFYAAEIGQLPNATTMGNAEAAGMIFGMLFASGYALCMLFTLATRLMHMPNTQKAPVLPRSTMLICLAILTAAEIGTSVHQFTSGTPLLAMAMGQLTLLASEAMREKAPQAA